MLPIVLIVVGDEPFTVDDAHTLLHVLRTESAVLPDGVTVSLHEDGTDGRPRFGGRRFRRAECRDLAERLEAVLTELRLVPGQ